jgi:hypothetical protein
MQIACGFVCTRGKHISVHLFQFVEFLQTIDPHESLSHMTSQQLMRFLLEKYCNLGGYPSPTRSDLLFAPSACQLCRGSTCITVLAQQDGYIDNRAMSQVRSPVLLFTHRT